MKKKEVLLHQLLAFEGDEVNKGRKVLSDVKNTFISKPNHFDGHSRTYHPDSDDTDRVDDEFTQIVTTVQEQLNMINEKVAKTFDTVLTKETTNSSNTAKAELIVEGESFGELSATSLLYLEKAISELRKVYETIPVLPPGKVWQYNSDTGVYETEQAVTFRNVKEIVPVVLYEATKEHPAQVKESSRNIKVGEYHEIKRSGRIFQKKKQELLDRLDILIKEIKCAREKANSIPVVEMNIGKKIFNFINKPVS